MPDPRSRTVIAAARAAGATPPRTPVARLTDVRMFHAVAAAAAPAPARAPRPATPAPPASARIVAAALAAPAGVQLTGVAQAKWLAPHLAARLHAVPTAHQGVPRERISVPVSPSEEVHDALLFEDAAGPGRWYLPRYRVASDRAVGGGHRFGVALASADAGGLLTVRLERFPPPELGDVGTAEELPHRIQVVLRFQFGPGRGGATKELVFQRVADVDGGVEAGLELTPSELNQVFGVLRDLDRGAELLVRRALKVGVPVKPTAGRSPGGPAGPARPAAPPPGARPAVRDHRAAAGRRVLVRDHRARAAGLHLRDARVAPVLAHVAVAGTGAAGGPDGSARLYRESERSLDTRVEPHPFVFEPELHPYVYQAARGVSGSRGGLVRRQERFAEGWHSYYQDEAEPSVFYYLPDAFKIARRPESPHNPFLCVSFEADEAQEGADATTVRFTCVGAPAVSLERLEAAQAALARHVPGGVPGPGGSAGGARLEPLLAGEANLALELPPALKEQLPGGVPVDLRTGFRFDLRLSLDQFQAIYDALFGASASLLDGAVTIPLGDGGSDGERVPFRARLDDLTGPVFDVEAPAAGSGGPETRFDFRLLQAIESPVRVDAVGIRLAAGEAVVDTTVEVLEAPVEGLPALLEPGATLRVRASPVVPLPEGATPPIPLLSPGGLIVEPDRERVWAAILDPTTPAEYVEEVEVFGLAEWFESGDPAQRVHALVVEFQGGGSVRLTAGELATRAQIPRPISDLVLRRVEEGDEPYRYRVTTVRSRGSSTSDWKEATASILYPELA